MASPVLEAPGDLMLPADAESGLSSYNLTLDVIPSGIAEIVSVTFPPWANISMNGTMPTEKTWIRGVDLGMQAEPGDKSLVLVTITIRGIADGKTAFVVVPDIVDDDLGGRYVLDSLQIPLQVGVVPTGTVIPASSKAKYDSSPSSGNTMALQTPIPTDTPLSPTVFHQPKTKETETTAITNTQSSPSPVIPADVKIKIPVEATPGFDCITTSLAGLVICLLSCRRK